MSEKLLKALLKRKHFGDIPTLWPLGLCYLFNSLRSSSLAYLWIWLTHSPAAPLDKIRQKMLIENPPSFSTESDFRIHWLAKPNLPAFRVLYGLIIEEDNLPARHPISAHDGWTQMGWTALVPGDPTSGHWWLGGGSQWGRASLPIRSPQALASWLRSSGGEWLRLSTHLGPCCNAGAYHCTQLLCCKHVSCGHKGEELSQPGYIHTTLLPGPPPRPPVLMRAHRASPGVGNCSCQLSGTAVVASILAWPSPWAGGSAFKSRSFRGQAGPGTLQSLVRGPGGCLLALWLHCGTFRERPAESRLTTQGSSSSIKNSLELPDPPSCRTRFCRAPLPLLSSLLPTCTLCPGPSSVARGWIEAQGGCSRGSNAIL